MQPAPTWRSRWARLLHGAPPGRFRLTQYFTVTSLVAFGVVATALYFLERAEQTFFEAVQREQNVLFAVAQGELVREQKAAARANLLREHEAGHVTLTKVLANALWEPQFAPLVERTRGLSLEPCRALTAAQPAASAPAPRQACFAELGQRIQALPGFADVHAAVHAAMRGTSVFKVKVYDMRGLTVYSSELAQVGEDKAENKGWISAAGGKPASELVHRDRFSAFEGEVENRDLIQTYVAVHAPGAAQPSGVFEIYSDVTALLGHIDAASARIGELAAANQARVDRLARDNQRDIKAASAQHFLILAALLMLLYFSLLVLVRNAQRIIDEQQAAREQAALREQQWHREKMAALATMAAEASHEVGNPLAVITGLADDIPRAQAAGESLDTHARGIVEQATRIAGMARRITQFAGARAETPEPLDVNAMVKAVADFLGFDSRFRGMQIEMRLAADLPACVGIPDHLNEVLMTLLQAQAEASMRMAPPGTGRVLLASEARGGEVVVTIGCASGAECCIPPGDSRLVSARRRMEGMGGRIASAGCDTEIALPCLASHPPA